MGITRRGRTELYVIVVVVAVAVIITVSISSRFGRSYISVTLAIVMMTMMTGLLWWRFSWRYEVISRWRDLGGRDYVSYWGGGGGWLEGCFSTTPVVMVFGALVLAFLPPGM